MSLSKQIADKERTKIKNRKNKKKGKETHHLSGKKVEVISQIIYIYIYIYICQWSVSNGTFTAYNKYRVVVEVVSSKKFPLVLELITKIKINK